MILTSQIGQSQLSPPGLGVAKTGGWLAFGVRQELDSLKTWTSMSYVGIGRKSNPDNYDPLFKSGIFVINQEFYHQFHRHWQYSFAFSYRRQDEYLEDPPYEYDLPRLKQEFRLYSRLSYQYANARIKFVPTIRAEARKFLTPDFLHTSGHFQWRFRFRLQLTVNLTKDKKNKLIVGSEQLMSISKDTKPGKWSDFNYRESRFTLYYSHTVSPFVINLGYMNNLVGTKSPYDVHYFAFDVIWENPFRRKK